MQGIFPFHPCKILFVPTHVSLERIATTELDPDGCVLLQKSRASPYLAAVRGKVTDFSSRAASYAIAAMAHQNNLIAVLAPIVWEGHSFHAK